MGEGMIEKDGPPPLGLVAQGKPRKNPNKSKKKNKTIEPKMDLLPRVQRQPCSGRMHNLPLVELADTSRVDRQHRMTREQVGPAMILGKVVNQQVKALHAEIKYKGNRRPQLGWRVTHWIHRPEGHYQPKRGHVLTLTGREMIALIDIFGGNNGPVHEMVSRAQVRLMQARAQYDIALQTHNAEKFEAQHRAEQGQPVVEAAHVYQELPDLPDFG